MTILSSDQQQTSVEPLRQIRVWDLPLRLFHWLTVAFVIISFTTGKIGGNLMSYHMWSGYAILVLLLFRLAWGFAGSRHARFAFFVRGPSAVMRYARSLLRKDGPKYLGHNPLGGWSVMAMFITLLLQAATGLFANDDIITEGPLYPWVNKTVSDGLTRLHKFNQDLIIILVLIHVLAILFYLIVKRENLITPMVTGFKQWRGPDQSAVENLWSAALIAGLAAVIVYLLVR